MVKDAYKASDEEAALNVKDKRKLFIPEATCVGNNGFDGTAMETCEINEDNKETPPLDFFSSLSNINENQYTESNTVKNADRLNKNLIWAIISVCFATVNTGAILGWSSPTLPKILNYGEKIHVNPTEGAWLSSLAAFSAMFGPYISGALIDIIGRKWTIMTFLCSYTTSWLILDLCSSIHLLYTARLIAGLGLGGISVAVPIYIAEISPTSFRGTLGSIFMVSCSLGNVLVYIIGPFTSYSTLNMMCTAIPLIGVVSFARVPESPYHLLNKGRKQEALDSLLWYRGNPQTDDLRLEIIDMMALAANRTKLNEGSFADLLKNRGYLKALYYACLLSFFQQSAGMNLIRFYAQSIFLSAGSNISASVCAIIVGSIMLGTTTCTTSVSKIFGIRKLMLFSTLADSITIGVLTGYFYLKENNHDMSSFSWLPLVCLVCFVIVYNLGLGPFLTVIMAEIFPAHLKGLAVAIVMSVAWIVMFLMTRYYDTVSRAFGQSFAFGFLSAMGLLAFLFVLLQLPDTEGKSFREIQEMLAGRKVKRNRHLQNAQDNT